MSNKSHKRKSEQHDSKKSVINDNESTISSSCSGSRKSCKTRKSTKSKSNKMDNNFFIVDKIIGQKVTNGVVYYKVRWQDYDENEDSWEPEENLSNVLDLIEDYLTNANMSNKRSRATNNYIYVSNNELVASKTKYFDDIRDGKIDLTKHDLYSRVKTRKRLLQMDENGKEHFIEGKDADEDSTAALDEEDSVDQECRDQDHHHRHHHQNNNAAVLDPSSPCDEILCGTASAELMMMTLMLQAKHAAASAEDVDVIVTVNNPPAHSPENKRKQGEVSSHAEDDTVNRDRHGYYVSLSAASSLDEVISNSTTGAERPPDGPTTDLIKPPPPSSSSYSNCSSLVQTSPPTNSSSMLSSSSLTQLLHQATQTRLLTEQDRADLISEKLSSSGHVLCQCIDLARLKQQAQYQLSVSPPTSLEHFGSNSHSPPTDQLSDQSSLEQINISNSAELRTAIVLRQYGLLHQWTHRCNSSGTRSLHRSSLVNNLVNSRSALDNYRPIEFALIHSCSGGVLRCLLNAGARIIDPEDESPVPVLAIKYDRADLLTILLDHPVSAPVSCDTRDSRGRSLLYWAIYYHSPVCLAVVLSRTPNIYNIDLEGSSAMNLMQSIAPPAGVISGGCGGGSTSTNTSSSNSSMSHMLARYESCQRSQLLAVSRVHLSRLRLEPKHPVFLPRVMDSLHATIEFYYEPPPPPSSLSTTITQHDSPACHLTSMTHHQSHHTKDNTQLMLCLVHAHQVTLDHASMWLDTTDICLVDRVTLNGHLLPPLETSQGSSSGFMRSIPWSALLTHGHNTLCIYQTNNPPLYDDDNHSLLPAAAAYKLPIKVICVCWEVSPLPSRSSSPR